MRNIKFKLARKWRVSLKRTRAAEEGSVPGHRCRNAAFQTHAGAHAISCSAYACIRGDKPAGPFAAGLGRSVGYELLDHARVFGELTHDVVRLIDGVADTACKLVPPHALDAAQTQHFSLLANQALKNAQRGSATCRQIDAVIADSVDRIRQGLLVLEQAGVQMLQVIDTVILASEVTAFSGCSRAAQDDEDSELLLQESALAVQDLKCWALVLKRNLQGLRVSESYETAFATPRELRAG
jgi:hypothetical protein